MKAMARPCRRWMASGRLALAVLLSCLSAGLGVSGNDLASTPLLEPPAAGTPDGSRPGPVWGSGPCPAFAGRMSPATGLTRPLRGASCPSVSCAGRLPVLRTRPARGALTTVCVFEQMTKGLGDLFGAQGKGSVDSLKQILVRHSCGLFCLALPCLSCPVLSCLLAGRTIRRDPCLTLGPTVLPAKGARVLLHN